MASLVSCYVFLFFLFMVFSLFFYLNLFIPFHCSIYTTVAAGEQRLSKRHQDADVVAVLQKLRRVALNAHLSRRLIGSRRWRNHWRHGITGETTLRHRRRHVYGARRASHVLLPVIVANRSIAPVTSSWRILAGRARARDVNSVHQLNSAVHQACRFTPRSIRSLQLSQLSKLNSSAEIMSSRPQF